MLERLLALSFLVLLLAGCGAGHGTKVGGIRRIQQVSRMPQVRDDPQVKKRMRYQEIMQLTGDRYGRGDLNAALGYAQSAQKIQPDNPAAYTLQAIIQGRLGAAAAAGDLYRRAAELAPAQGDVLNNYGAWLCANGYPAEALVWFDRALNDANYASRADALANAGGCALDAGQNERADQNLRQALELSPNNAYALESMARSEYARGHYLEARAFSQRRLAAAPATASVLQLAAQIEERLGDRNAASQYQRRLREEFPAAPGSQG